MQAARGALKTEQHRAEILRGTSAFDDADWLDVARIVLDLNFGASDRLRKTEPTTTWLASCG